jgi:hypothetical protein
MTKQQHFIAFTHDRNKHQFIVCLINRLFIYCQSVSISFDSQFPTTNSLCLCCDTKLTWRATEQRFFFIYPKLTFCEKTNKSRYMGLSRSGAGDWWRNRTQQKENFRSLNREISFWENEGMIDGVQCTTRRENFLEKTKDVRRARLRQANIWQRYKANEVFQLQQTIVVKVKLVLRMRMLQTTKPTTTNYTYIQCLHRWHDTC